MRMVKMGGKGRGGKAIVLHDPEAEARREAWKARTAAQEPPAASDDGETTDTADDEDEAAQETGEPPVLVVWSGKVNSAGLNPCCLRHQRGVWDSGARPPVDDWIRCPTCYTRMTVAGDGTLESN